MTTLPERSQAILHRPVTLSMKALLIITAILDGLYAVTLLLTPGQFLAMHGLGVNEAMLFTTRLLSPAVISDALLALFGLYLLNSREALRAIAFKFFVSWGIGGAVILMGKLTIESMSAAAWVDVAFAAIFTGLWAYLFVSLTSHN